jgi:hypothetical protein
MSVIDRTKVLHDLAMKLRQVGRIQIARILGTVPSTHGGYKALIDLFERCHFMRAEINAITSLMLAKGLVSEAEVSKAFEEEMAHYLAAVVKDWPEIEFQADGYTIKDVEALAKRSKREEWPP